MTGVAVRVTALVVFYACIIVAAIAMALVILGKAS